MKHTALVIGATASLVGAVPGHASVATLRLVATVPVSCSIDIVGTRVVADSVVVSLRRECNAAHDVVISGGYLPVSGRISLRLGSARRDVMGDQVSIAQPESYYQGADELILTSDGSDSDELVRFASSLSIGVETR